ncbi:MAG TPA: hypothetical protein VND68_13550 [Chloroflexia bacterium]|jgi:hypothetical protein|nr:hypothetical protein [Chloroflexia bacterium]
MTSQPPLGVTHQPDTSESIPISDWVDTSDVQEDDTVSHLGPTDIEQGAAFVAALTGKPPFIFSNKKYDLGQLDYAGIMPVDVLDLLDIQRYAFRHTIANTALVSDGNTSHAISLQNFAGDDPDRLLFYDPWGVGSFLEEGRNIAGIKAQPTTESGANFSITFDEYSRVLVAAVFMDLEGKLESAIIFRQLYSELSTSEFFSFFGLHETKPREKRDDRTLIALKTGGFQESIDIVIQIDAQGFVRHGTLRLARAWINEYRLNPFALDVTKSFVAALIPTSIDLSSLGVRQNPVIENPDRSQAAFLASALFDLVHQERTRQNFSQPNKLPATFFPIILAFLGREDSAQVTLVFSSLTATNVRSDTEDVFRLEIDASPPQPPPS